MLSINKSTSNKSYQQQLGLTILSIMAFFSISCANSDPQIQSDSIAYEVIDSASVDVSRLYIPKEFEDMNFYESTSQWSFFRSRQSEHFIVFWADGYGDLNPASSEVPEKYRVNIDDLLSKAEDFYTVNIEQLKFAETGVGKSNLDKYKMMIFLFYQEEWMATGAGYDDTIGALWISPNTCQPVGGVLGHEIGHSFQYQVFCDLGGDAGFRYGFGGNGGNGFWEQTAQWQAFQSYPEQVFTAYHFPVYTENYHRHLIHENYRYASYFIHYYWAEKHGIDMIGKIWRGARKPEDPIQAYMRLTEIDVTTFNDEVYEAASKMVTWDLDALREKGKAYIGAHKYALDTLTDKTYQVAYSKCPGTTGYNVIPLEVPKAGSKIAIKFDGLTDATGFNPIENKTRAGWRYGFVALLSDGTREYGEMNSASSGTARFKIPTDCERLWFVVTGAPNSYKPHAWDDDESNDDQWPYQIELKNCSLSES